MQRITGLNTKCVFIIFINIIARNVKVVRFVYIIYKDVFVRFVMVQKFVFIINKDVFVRFVVVQKFVFIINKDVFARFVQTQLKLQFKIGLRIQSNLIRNIIVMMQIDLLISVS